MLSRQQIREASIQAHNRSGDRTKIIGSTVPSIRTIEAHRGDHDKRRGLITITASNYTGTINVDRLAYASELYKISPDPKDYVLVEVPIVTVDIPNRNAQGFPYEEVTCFERDAGDVVYRTFIGKPTCLEHKNDTNDDAQGINFDASLRYVPEYDVYKIFVLSGFDRSKNKWLADEILAGRRKYYSMGALVRAFVASCCGKIHTDKELCPHMKKHGKGALVDGNILWQLCTGAAYDENSSVDDPADVTAGGDLL